MADAVCREQSRDQGAMLEAHGDDGLDRTSPGNQYHEISGSDTIASQLRDRRAVKLKAVEVT